MSILPSKPGIGGATVLDIPKEWDPKWFRNFIANQLKGADTRNATSSDGSILINGTLASPFANLRMAFPVTAQRILTVQSSVDETRVSTTTPTNSTQYLLSLTAGTWDIDWIIIIKQASAGSVGVNYNVNYSGTFTVLGGWIGCGNNAGSSPGGIFFGPGFCASAPSTTQFSVTQCNTFGTPFFGRGTIVTTTTGTLAIAFAQNVSSTTVITLQGSGSVTPSGFLRATRIA